MMKSKIKKIISVSLFQLTLCYILPIKKIRKPVFILMLILDFLIFVTWKRYNKYKSKIGINGLLQNLNRNYDKLILGRKNIDENVSINNCLDFRNYCRNFYTDVLFMERYYSFLKKNGVVEFNISNDYSYLNDNFISIFDASFLHKVTVYKHSKYLYRYVFDCKEIFTGFIFMFKGLIDIFRRYSDSNKLDRLLLKIDNVVEFATSRNITLHFKLHGFSKKFIDSFAKKYPNVVIDYL